MHFCVSDHVSEWLSQIVLDKVHLRWEIEALRPLGEDPRHRKRDSNVGPIGRAARQYDTALAALEALRLATSFT